MGLHAAIIEIHRKFKMSPVSLDSIEFCGITTTKRDALVKEVKELFKAKNLDQLVCMSHQAAIHMQQMGLFEVCQPRIDTTHRSAAGQREDLYAVKFIVQENKRPIKINVKMEMRTTGDLDAGVGARRINIFGRGETAELSYIKGIRDRVGYNFGFTAMKPFLGWQNYDNISTQISRSTEFLRWNKSDLIENAAIFQLNTGHLLNRLKSSLRLNLIWRFFQPRNDTPFPVREHAGHTTKISLEHILSSDTRDRPILPSTGTLCRLSTEMAGPLGDSALMKYIFDYQTAKQLPLFGLIFGASFRLAQMKSLGSRNVHLLDRLYAGGPYDVRGFDINSIGIRTENCSLGGGASLTSAFHLFVPLIPKDMLFAHLFLNTGSVSSVRSKQMLNDLIEMQRISAGFGLVLNFMNAARLEMNYVFPFRSFPGDNCAPGIQLAAGINFM